MSLNRLQRYAGYEVAEFTPLDAQIAVRELDDIRREIADIRAGERHLAQRLLDEARTHGIPPHETQSN